jgi:glycosyltransferase involved in cell wall biosynthesis
MLLMRFNYVSEIIVISNKSTDNTIAVAQNAEPLYYLKIIRDMVMPV